MVDSRTDSNAALIRIGGAALLVSLVIHIVANLFLKEFPPADPTLTELRNYLDTEAATWRVVHGMRYAAVVCLALFFAGILLRVQKASDISSGGWEYVGLIGGVLHMASLFLTNGIETLAFLDFDLLAENPELFWLVFNATRVLFTAEVVAWAIMIFGFSVAGLLSRTLPGFISVLGIGASALALLSGLMVGAIMTSSGWPTIAIDVATLSSLAWFLGTGAFLAWKGSS